MNDFKGCDESLLLFYDLVKKDNEGNVVLKPKSLEEYKKIKDKRTYEWCFDYVDGTKVIQVDEGPMDAEGVVERFAEHVGCTDFEKGFFCENGEGELNRIGERKCVQPFTYVVKHHYPFRHRFDFCLTFVRRREEG